MSFINKEIETKQKVANLFQASLNNENEYLELFHQLEIHLDIQSVEMTPSSIVSLLRFCADKNFFHMFESILSVVLTSYGYSLKNKAFYKQPIAKNILLNYAYFLEKFVINNKNFSFFDIHFFKHDSLAYINVQYLINHISKHNVTLDNFHLSEKMQHCLQENVNKLLSLKKYDKCSINRLCNIEILKIENIFNVLDFNSINRVVTYILDNNVNDASILQSLLNISIQDRTEIFDNLLFMVAKNSLSSSAVQKLQFFMSFHFHRDLTIKDVYMNNEKVRYLLVLQDF